jgi:hypothetical protein
MTDHVITNDGTAPREVEPTVSGRSFIAQIIYLLFGILSAFLIIRFLLSLFGANRSNDFASFIYHVSNPFVRPFFGLFNTDFVWGNGTGRFEYETVVAFVVYALICALLIKIVSLGKRNVTP